MKGLVLKTLGLATFIYLFTQLAHCSEAHPKGLMGVNSQKIFGFKLVDVASAQHHQMTKRQINGNLTLLDIADCTLTFYDSFCSYMAQKLIEIDLSCGSDPDDVRSTASECARSESGDFCVTAFNKFDLVETVQMNLERSCSAVVASNFCPSTCRSLLEDFRSRLGCCINTYINGTDGPILYQPYVSYRLWNLCGVPLPAADCENGLTLNAPADTQTCTSEERFNSLYQQYLCLPSVGQPYINALLRDSRCRHRQLQNYLTAQMLVDYCSVNADGVSCWSYSGSGGTGNVIDVDSLNSVCISSNISCSSACRSGINEARTAVGCCVNVHNTSISGTDNPSLSYSVWRSCGVESPGFCESPLSLNGDISTMERAVTWTTVTIVTMLMSTV